MDDSIYQKIVADTTKFNLGDEEVRLVFREENG
jgi:hypothetical protein